MKHFSRALLCAATLSIVNLPLSIVHCPLSITMAQPAVSSKAISPILVGTFFEDLNYAADGGLYGELVQNRSFEYAPSDIDLHMNKGGTWHSLTAWQFVRSNNAIGRVTVESAAPLNGNNRHYAQLTTFTDGTRGVGLRNMGYDGICVDSMAQYDFSVFVRAAKGTLLVRLTEADSLLAEQTLTLDNGEWQQKRCTLFPKRTSTNASLEVMFPECGTYDIDMVSLFPHDTYRGRPGGLRRDLATAIEDLHPAFMRFPGGCLAHGDGLPYIYRWKPTVGPVEARAEMPNIWNYRQSMGVGYHEYLQLCEDIGAEPVPVLAAGVSCQNSARRRGDGQEAVPMEDMDDFIQDFLDLVEYCNGDTATTWGRCRAEAGHPEPFNLKYIGVGNEDHITSDFEERFAMICRVMRVRHPEIKLIGTAGPCLDDEDFRLGWAAARKAGVWGVDEHQYAQPEWFLNNLHRYDSYPRTGPKVYLGEWASRGNKWWNALCEAAFLCHLERNGDVVAMASYAPLFCRINPRRWNWKPDLIFFDNTHVYPSVNYAVQQLFGTTRGDRVWTGIISDVDGNEADATSCVTKDRDIFIRLVNTTDQPVQRVLKLAPLRPRSLKASIEVLTADRDAEATPENPSPINRTTEYKRLTKTYSYEMPPYSVTIIRL